MSPRRLAMSLAVLALPLFAACQDDKTPPTAPVAAPAAELSVLKPDGAPNLAASINKQVASVCKAYRKAGVQMKKDLAKSPNDPELQEQAKALDEMIVDACN